MRENTLARFILGNTQQIVDEWEAFAMTLGPAARAMDSLALRDHAKPMLEAIARDIETSQSDRQQESKSKGHEPSDAFGSSGSMHGMLRQMAGFDLRQLVAEFRALRATVLKLWDAKKSGDDADCAYDITRFNEAVDQALAESVDSYSRELADSRDTFLAILGHDLRSPLGAISGALHILSQNVSDEKRSAAYAAGASSVSAMSNMVRDLLEYTRSRLGKGIPVTPGPADLAALCKTAISEISLVHRKSEFKMETAGRLDGVFDSERMRQVVSNLLNNAVEHGKPGTPVSLIARGDGDALTIEVKNQGPPIPSEHLHAIFDPLVQIPGEGSDTRPPTNLGLGLYIAREIVLAHGGTISVESSLEGGTVFTIGLPRKPSGKVAKA